MGRPVGKAEISPEAAAALALFKRNVEKRLATLDVSAALVGQRTGRGYSWLRDIMYSDRYNSKISLNLVAEVAKALGVRVNQLVSSYYDGRGTTPWWWVGDPPLPRSKPTEEKPCQG